MPKGHIDICVGGVVVPVGHTIANHETLEVGLEDGVVSRILGVVLVNKVSEIRHVDASV
jgi:hypothetical protein